VVKGPRRAAVGASGPSGRAASTMGRGATTAWWAPCRANTQVLRQNVLNYLVVGHAVARE